MAREGYDFTMIEEDTYSIVTEKIPAGKTYCSLCSRLRRGILYRVAKELGCNKIALGHHRDDVAPDAPSESLLRRPARRDAAEARSPTRAARRHPPARLLRRRGHPRVLRARPVSDPSRATCAARRRTSSARPLARLIDQLEREHPGTKTVMLAALQNVRPSHLLDQGLWRKLGLTAAPDDEAEGGATAPLAPQRLLRG